MPLELISDCSKFMRLRSRHVRWGVFSRGFASKLTTTWTSSLLVRVLAHAIFRLVFANLQFFHRQRQNNLGKWVQHFRHVFFSRFACNAPEETAKFTDFKKHILSPHGSSIFNRGGGPSHILWSGILRRKSNIYLYQMVFWELAGKKQASWLPQPSPQTPTPTTWANV